MRFKSPRQILSGEVIKIISREMRKQRLKLSCTTRKEIIQIAQVVKEIEQQGLPKQFICKKLSKDLGYGIFLRLDAQPIKKGQLIAPYAGEISFVPQHEDNEGSYAFTPVERIHLNKVEQALFDAKHRYSPRRLYFLKVDARRSGNFTRFINHSEKPNIVAYTLSIPPNAYGVEPSPVEIVYFAKKLIRPGEQLLVSYEDGEKSYWLDGKPHPMTPSTFQL
jgi:SET domain-containing protein